jgi:hypothetical protein
MGFCASWNRSKPNCLSFLVEKINASLAIAPLPTTAAAIVRITDDHGGNIGAHWSRYMALRDTGEQIVIDGACSSACTLVPEFRI